MKLKPSRTPPATGPIIDVIAARSADVGMPVARSLPSARRRAVGPWVFADHFGPATPARPVNVAPHPHCGLATVTWLFEGEGLHRDSLGSAQRLRPGEVNWMTAGHGISHSEDMPAGPVHGAQLWVALPPESRSCPPRFEHQSDLPQVSHQDADLTVFAGESLGHTSPVRVDSPLVGAAVRLDGQVDLPLDPTFEHALLVVEGSVRAEGEPVPVSALAYLGTGRSHVRVEGVGTFLLLGGEPYPEPLLMWWNFVVPDDAALRSAVDDWASGSPRFGNAGQPERPRTEAPALP